MKNSAVEPACERLTVNVNRSLLIAVLVLTGTSCADSPVTPTPTPYPAPTGPFTLSGRVIDFSSGAGIAGVGLVVGGQRLTTDAGGMYSVRVGVGNHTIEVDGEPFPSVIFARGPWTRGDFIAHPGACHARYGAVMDRRTGAPIAGATVRVGGLETKTGVDAWYRHDINCQPCDICGTAVITVSAHGYKDFLSVVGRGVNGVRRLDVEMDPVYPF